jgi:hypothetical protein
MKAKKQMQQQKAKAESEMRKAQSLSERCLAKQDNVTVLKKALCAEVRAKEDLSATLKRERQRYV